MAAMMYFMYVITWIWTNNDQSLEKGRSQFNLLNKNQTKIFLLMYLYVLSTHLKF